jgi:membrane protease YdiL (CAAX protease family)
LQDLQIFAPCAKAASDSKLEREFEHMQEPLVSERHPVVSLLFIFLTVGIGFIFLGPAIGLALASPFYDGNLLADITRGEVNPEMFAALMLMQGTATFFGLILFPYLYVRFLEQKSPMRLFKNENDWIRLVVVLIAVGVCFQLAISPIIEWNMNFRFPEYLNDFGNWAREQENALMELTRFLTTFSSAGDFMIGLVVIALLPGIGEEFVFRGLIQNEFHRGTQNIHLAIWVSAFLFSAIHMQFFGFIPRMLLGALFGYLYHWSGNLLVPMIAHFFHNGFTLTMMYLYQVGTSPIDPEDNETAPLYVVGVCALAVIVLLFYFRKFYSVNGSLGNKRS